MYPDIYTLPRLCHDVLRALDQSMDSRRHRHNLDGWMDAWMDATHPPLFNLLLKHQVNAQNLTTGTAVFMHQEARIGALHAEGTYGGGL